MAIAVAFTAPNTVELVDYTPPNVREGEVLIRTEFSGVSQGTEVWALTGRRRELSFPTVPGYQGVGVIEAIGPGVDGFSVGQRVLYHRSRLPAQFTETWMGGHVSHVVSRTDGDPPLRAVSDGVDLPAAALAAMPAVSLRGVDMLEINPNDVVVVTGLGLIGQAAAMLARLRGAIVIASDLHPRRLELAGAHAADVVVDAKTDDLGQAVRALRPEGADAVIETTGRIDMFAPCIDLLRLRGQLLLQGFYPDPVSFDFHETHLKRPTIQISCGIGDTDRILELMRFDRLPWSPLITDKVKPDDAPAMYQRLLEGDPGVLGIVLDWRAAH